ncbi:MAG: ATPase [Alistipes sp.]|nr:ATPase [Alistipes sp.]
MKLIVESGATKGDWRVVGDGGEAVASFRTAGTNVSTMPLAAVNDIVRTICEDIASAGYAISEVYMYTAGVVTERVVVALSQLFRRMLSCDKVEICDDLTAAARAACGHQAGIVAILGTGSNSCQYDGEKIVKRVYSSGFILGDEGSAATLGKLFIADFLKGLVPEEVAADFRSRYPSDYATIIANVYRSEGSPSGYLGGFAPFIMEHYANPYIQSLVDENFRAFITRSLRQYDVERYPIGVVGGFGNALREVFERVAAQEGIRIARFISTPIEELIKYHTI